MQQPNHPDDERLAALAASEPDALADGSLVTHVSGCPRCTPIIDELRTLRSALAELPDVPPSRPLRFLPPVPEPTTTRPGWLGLLRGITAPAMAVAVVLILVGAFGTASGSFSLGSAGAAPALNFGGAGAAQASPTLVPAAQGGDGKAGASPTASGSRSTTGLFGNAGGGSPAASANDESARAQYHPTTPTDGLLAATPSSRPPFEWLLGAGVVLLAAAFVARGYVRRRLPV